MRSFVGRKRPNPSTPLTPPPPRSAHTLSAYPSTPRASTSISGQQQQSPEGVNDLQRRWHAVYCYTALKGSGMTEAEAAQQTALQFSCSESTIRSWKKRVDEEGDLSRKRYSADRGRDLEVVSQAMEAVIQRVRAPIAQRTLLTLANSLLLAEGEDKVSLHTMQRVLSSDQWRKLKQKAVPVCTEETKEDRRLWCTAKLQVNSLRWTDRYLSWVLPRRLEVHIDEKWFYAFPRSTRVMYLPTSMVDELEYVHRVEKRNPKRQPHLMFLGAVAKPEPEYDFDGRIGLWPLIEEEKVYQRTGPNYKRGQRKVVPIIITHDVFVGYLWRKVLPAILQIMKERKMGARSIVIQMDFAGGHGGGHGGRERKVKYEKELNDAAAKVLTEHDCPFGTTVTFDVQPSSSPDLNALDLGVWYSLAAGVADARADQVGEECANTILEGLLYAVMHRWDSTWDATNKLKQVFATRDRILEVVAKDGTNEYKIPRSGESHAKEEPTFVPEVFDEDENAANGTIPEQDDDRESSTEPSDASSSGFFSFLSFA